MRQGLLMLLLASIALAEDVKPVQVLKDTGFDAGPAKTPAEGWFNQAEGEEGVTSEWLKDSGRNGSPCIHIAATKDSVQPHIWRQVVSDPPTLRRYSLRGWVKAKDVSNDVIICIRCTDAKGTLVGFGTTQGTSDVKGTTDWKEVRCELVPAADTKTLDVLCFLMGTGDCWFDDVTLEAGERAEATPLQGGQADLGKDQPGIVHLRGVYDVQVVTATPEPVVLLPLPLVWGPQVPLRWEVRSNPCAMIDRWHIQEYDEVNRYAWVHLLPLSPGDRFRLEWEADVLCGPSEFKPLPQGVGLDALSDVPDDAKLWLESTSCVQCGDPRFAAIAKELKEGAKDVADLVARIQGRLGDIQRGQKGQAADLGALEALDHTGSCTSNANLAAAVYRACGFPTRILSGYPLWSGPLQTHYIVEVRFPRHGWFPVESTMLRTPWPQSQQIAVSLVYPRDEGRSDARWTAAGGVPYLSLTEAPGSENHFLLRGAIDGHPGCDHEAVRAHDLPRDDAAWPEALAAARVKWEAWLGEGAHGGVPQETLEDRRPVGDCKSLAELMALLRKK